MTAIIVSSSIRPVWTGLGGWTMTWRRALLLDCPRELDGSGSTGHTRERGAVRRRGRSARGGAALPAHERHVLLPLRLQRAVGTRAAAVRGHADVPRRPGRPLLARGRGRR